MWEHLFVSRYVDGFECLDFYCKEAFSICPIVLQKLHFVILSFYGNICMVNIPSCHMLNIFYLLSLVLVQCSALFLSVNFMHVVIPLACNSKTVISLYGTLWRMHIFNPAKSYTMEYYFTLWEFIVDDGGDNDDDNNNDVSMV